MGCKFVINDDSLLAALGPQGASGVNLSCGTWPTGPATNMQDMKQIPLAPERSSKAAASAGYSRTEWKKIWQKDSTQFGGEWKETEGMLMSDSQCPVPISGFVGQRDSLASTSRTSSLLYREESLTIDWILVLNLCSLVNTVPLSSHIPYIYNGDDDICLSEFFQKLMQLI